MTKTIHLSNQQAVSKLATLQQELLICKDNKTKRKRIYHQISQLKKAIQQQNLIDPQEIEKRKDQDKQKRISKKVQKKEEVKKEVKKIKRHQKRCLRCGSREHLLQDCGQGQSMIGQEGVSKCFKCGGNDHTHKQCQNQSTYVQAQCFYCGEKGHIARECEKNQKGLYRMGGSCFGCGSVRHTLKDCPTRHGKSASYSNKEEF